MEIAILREMLEKKEIAEISWVPTNTNFPLLDKERSALI